METPVPGNRQTQTYRGACHCGAVRFQIETDFAELTMCDCSLCKKKNALMVRVEVREFLSPAHDSNPSEINSSETDS